MKLEEDFVIRTDHSTVPEICKWLESEHGRCVLQSLERPDGSHWIMTVYVCLDLQQVLKVWEALQLLFDTPACKRQNVLLGLAPPVRYGLAYSYLHPTNESAPVMLGQHVWEICGISAATNAQCEKLGKLYSREYNPPRTRNAPPPDYVQRIQKAKELVQHIDQDTFGFNKDPFDLSVFPNVRRIMDRAFASTTQVQGFDKCKHLITIGTEAFGSMTNTPDLHEHPTLSIIGYAAFLNSEGPVDLSGCKRLSHIDALAFANNKKHVNLDNCPTLEVIGIAAFLSAESVSLSGCSNLSYINADAFLKAKGTLDISKSVNLIAVMDGAFASMVVEDVKKPDNNTAYFAAFGWNVGDIDDQMQKYGLPSVQ